MYLERNDCKSCGAPIDLNKAVNGVVVCEYCHSRFTVLKEKPNPAALSFLRQGEHDLDTCKFDDAYEAFAKAAELSPNEPEAYFGMALAKFRVQFLKDVVNDRLQPICHDISASLFGDDANYRRALTVATPEQIGLYVQNAQEIDRIRKEFYAIRSSGLEYDCFLCVKVTGEDGRRTDDCDRANDIYYFLKDKGYKPFFSEREMRGRTGADYEALILYALYIAPCMIVVCSDEGYLHTPWVKNEYTRFLGMIADEEKSKDAITIAFHGTPVERLPGRNGKIQGIDLGKMSALSDVEDYVCRHKEAAPISETIPSPADAPDTEEEKKKDAEEEKQEPSNPDFVMKGTTLVKYSGAEKDVTIPQGTKQIGTNAFNRRGGIERIELPEGVTSIGDGAFYRCVRLTDINIPDSVTSIGYLAFEGCEALQNVAIPNGVRFIGDWAFNACKALTNIVIPNSVASIGERAFYGCDSLKSVTMPRNLTGFKNSKLKKIFGKENISKIQFTFTD